MTNQLGSPPSRASSEAFIEGVAALRRAILTSTRLDDALRDVLSLARRHLRVETVGIWIDATRRWVTPPGTAIERLDPYRTHADLRDGAVRFALVAQGREFGALIGLWSPPSSLDLATCAAFEELSEYAALAMLCSRAPRRGTDAPHAVFASSTPPQPAAALRPITEARPAPTPSPAEISTPESAPGANGNGHRSAAEPELLSDLRSAIMSEQIHPHFQPMIRLSDGHVVAFEALARWEHDRLGWVSPGEFIPIAERHGLIASLGMRMLSDAARQVGTWSGSRDVDAARIILNLSPVQLKSRSLVTEVGNVVRRHRLRSGMIVLELTGDGSFDTARTAGLLERFEGAGVHIAVGDPDALSHLRASAHAVAAGFVKVPRRLVGSVVRSNSARREIERMVVAGQAAGIAIAAEGVETADELEALRGLGVELAQGFFWSPALPAAEATALLRRQPWA